MHHNKNRLNFFPTPPLLPLYANKSIFDLINRTHFTYHSKDFTLSQPHLYYLTLISSKNTFCPTLPPTLKLLSFIPTLPLFPLNANKSILDLINRTHPTYHFEDSTLLQPQLYYLSLTSSLEHILPTTPSNTDISLLLTLYTTFPPLFQTETICISLNFDWVLVWQDYLDGDACVGVSLVELLPAQVIFVHLIMTPKALESQMVPCLTVH